MSSRQRHARPGRELVRIVIEAIRHAPIGRERSTLTLPAIAESLELLALECRRTHLINLQVNDPVMHKREHRAIGEDAGTAEQAAQVHRAENGEQFADILGSHAKARGEASAPRLPA